MIRSSLAALLVCLLHAFVSAQVTNWPAPNGNVQALTITGIPYTGQPIRLEIEGDPGTIYQLYFASRLASTQSPWGVFLLDITEAAPWIDGRLDAQGQASFTAPFPALPVGSLMHVQAAMLSPQAGIQFSNRSSVQAVQGPGIAITAPAIGQIVNRVDPQVSGQIFGGPVMDVASFQATLDGNDVTASMNVLPMGFTGTLPPVVDGTHTLTVTIDETNGPTYMDSITFETSTGGGPTTVQGRVLDPDTLQPIVGVHVQFVSGGPSTTTNTQGEYALVGTPFGSMLQLDIDGQTAAPRLPNTGYPLYRKLCDEIVEGAVNELGITYLPIIDNRVALADLEQQGIFNCTQSRFLREYVYENPVLGWKVTFPAGTVLQFKPGSPPPCQNFLSISNVPVERAPSEMPESFRPDVLVTFQPTGMKVFDSRGNPISLPVTIPNQMGYAPGSQVSFMGFDHDTGEFVPTGVMEARGQELVTIAGGLRGGSWHTPMIPPPDPPNPPDCSNCNGPGPCANTNPDVDLTTGFIREVFGLPRRRIFDASFGLDLVFNSERVCPDRILRVEYVIDPNITFSPQAVEYIRFDVALGQQDETLRVQLPGVPLGETYIAAERRALFASSWAVISLDIRQLETGVVPYYAEMVRVVRGANGSASVIQSGRGISGQFIQQWAPDGPFGRGWSISLDDRVEESPLARDILLVQGNGTATPFRDSVLALGSQLTFKMFSDSSDQAVQGFFSGQSGQAFNTVAGGGQRTSVAESVVPNVQFYRTPGPYLLHVGNDGVQQTLDPNDPLGDDLVFEAPGASDTFGALMEGYLIVPQAGDVTFTVFADDAAALEINGQVVATLDGTSPVRFARSQPITLTGGYLPIRVAYADQGGDSRLWITASGGGFDGRIIASGAFSTVNGPATQQVYVGRDRSQIARLSGGGWERSHPDGTIDRFDVDGYLVERRDRNGRTISISRDAQGQILALIDPAGGMTSFTYTGNHVTEITDAAGRTTKLTYSGVDLIGIEDPNQATWAYGYSPEGYLTSRTDPDGNTNRHSYTPQGRFRRTTYPDGNFQEIFPAELVGLNLATSPESPGPATGYEEGVGRHIDEMGREFVIRYDEARGEQVTRDRGGRETLTWFNRRHPEEIQQVVRSDGWAKVWTRDRRGLVQATYEIQQSEPFGHRTAYTWHPVWPLLLSVREGVSTPLERVSLRYDYDGRGNIVAIHDAQGLVSRTSRDGSGRTTRITLADGSTTDITYEPTTGNRATVTAQARTTSFVYDAAGNLIRRTRPDGTYHAWTFDGVGRPLTWREPGGATTGYTYSAAGSFTHMRDAKGADYTFEYDARRRLTAFINPAGARETYNLTPGGLVDSLQRRDGTVLDYTYDDLGRVTRLDAGGEVTTYGYNADGFLSGVQSPDSTTTLTYSAYGDLIGERTSAYGVVSELAHAFDRLRRPISTTVRVNGTVAKTTSYSYTANDRLAAIEDAVQHPSVTNGLIRVDYTYDVLGRRTRITRSGIQTDYLYNPEGRLARLTHSQAGQVLLEDQLTYDASGLPETVTQIRSLLGNDTTTNTFDAARQLLSVSHSAAYPSESFGPYDPVGNRRTNSNTYTTDDRLVQTGTHEYDYDANGNIVRVRALGSSLALKEFDYSPLGQLREARVYGAGGALLNSETYGYDGFGRRIRKGDVVYTYNGADIVVANRMGSEFEVVTHGAGLDEPVAVSRSGEVLQFLADTTNSIASHVSAAGVVHELRYDAYGNVLDSGGALGAGLVDYRYASREWDEVSGLCYNRARYYLSREGLFVQSDPALLALVLGGMRSAHRHPYVYGANNPVVYSDPFGLYCEELRPLVEACDDVADELDIGCDAGDDQLAGAACAGVALGAGTLVGGCLA